MLREIIASILIPAFLMQILGCYSTTELTKYDLIRMKDKEVIKLVTKDSTEYMLQNPPETFNSHLWSVDKKNIYIYSKSINLQKNERLAQVDSLIIPLNKIESISTDIYDADKTVMWIFGIGFVFTITLLILVYAFAEGLINSND